MPTATTERDLLMPSLRPMLMPSSTDLVPILMLTLDMERGPPMLSPRLMLMPTTTLGPTATTVATGDTTVATGDTTMDKSSSRVPSKSSTRTSLLVNLTFHPSVRLLGGVGN